MAFHARNAERKRISLDFRRHEKEEVVGSLCRLGVGDGPMSEQSVVEQEKRIRREIANSNERRRMQSINAGFQSLRHLLPKEGGDKLSKAAILQNTADYIYQLEQEKTRLLEQNCLLKRRIINSQNNPDSDGSGSDSPLPKRKKNGDFLNEGIGCPSESSAEDVKRELAELRRTLEEERSVRATLENQIRSLESRLSGHDPNNCQSAPEDPAKSLSMSLMLDDTRSPESNTEVDSTSQEAPLRESSPELPVAEDLSGKNNSVLLPCMSELSLSDIPGLLLSHTPFSPDFSMELGPYKPSPSRQNLEAIVEAIRHVEGDHMFRDDPRTESTDGISFQHQIIRNAPVSQSRPGVIVSNHS